MKTSKPAGPRAEPRSGEGGAILMFVLLAMLLIAMVTITVMNFIAADQAAGIRELQAVQVFSVADAGAQYALGRLQASGANTYAGQTLTITAGVTTLGTAAVTVNCIDTGAAPPCGGTWAGYRRIVSTGSLPVAGPSRTVVAVAQGYGLAQSPFALCATTALTAQTGAAIHGDIGSNGTISLQSGANIIGDSSIPPQYTGLARADGTITCSSSCSTQIQGGATPNATGWVCPTAATGTFSPGSTNHTIFPGVTWTMNGITGYNWATVTALAGTCVGPTPYTTIRIQAGAAGTTTVVQMNQLTMAGCTRLMILGSGNVDLRIGAATGTGLSVGPLSHFGVLSTDTQATPRPVPASQFEVEVNSSATCSGGCAVNIQSTSAAGVASGIFLVPNGEIHIGTSEQMSGAILASTITIGPTVTYTYDTTAGSGAPVFSTFDNLRSWKDQ